MIKKSITALMVFFILVSVFVSQVFASGMEEIPENWTNIGADDSIISSVNIDVNAKSAVLMEANTGTVLYAKDANLELPPASVTKIMTLLLVAEALASDSISLTDKVSVSSNAASMGGSQIFIKEGEEFTVEDLLKSTVIASANDAAVALAELVAGSESAFVDKMNQRAQELGMKNTTFENATGLDDTVTKHLTSAYDIALMSRELIKHDAILKYSNIWQDSIRNGEFVLTNTNRLVRYYSGCTGLKTGSTDKAGFCVSATAERDGMHLIAVIMGSETREARNESARTLLDYGFSSYALYKDPGGDLEDVDVKKGDVEAATVYSRDFCMLVNKADLKKIEKKYNIPSAIIAPAAKDSAVGEIIYTLDGTEIGRESIYIKEEITALGFFDVLWRLVSGIVVG